MKRSLAVILSLLFVVSTAVFLSTCGGGGTSEPEKPGGYTVTEDLGGGVKATVSSPVPVTCSTSPPAGSYNDGWSKVPEMAVTGALGSGQFMTVTYESSGGFDAEDKIAFVDGDGNWIPVDSTIRQVGDTISASVNQCNTVFGAGPVYTLEVTVDYVPAASVDADHPLYVGAFCVNWTDPEPYKSDPITASGGSFSFELPAEQYVLFIFLDENDSGKPDVGEPYKYYDGSDDEAGATVITLNSDLSVIVSLDDTYTYPATGTVEIIDPNGQTLSSDFAATGTYSGDVTAIQVAIDGSPAGSATLDVAKETWSFDVSVAGLSETTHTISVEAYYNGTLLDSDDSTFTYSITPVNNPPTLTGGGVTPTTGDTSDTFIFSVDYFDIDGDAPLVIQLNIKGTPYDMTLESGIESDGTYSCSVSGAVLGGGSHSYSFSCDDGNGGTAVTKTFSLIVSVPAPQVTATFTFRNQFTGDTIQGVVWHDAVANADLVSDTNGLITLQGASPLKMKGYIVGVPSGYYLDENYYVNVSLTEDLGRTVFIPDSYTSPIYINGNITDKNGDPLVNGWIEVYTSDGREVGGGAVTAPGSYAGGVMTTGNLYFIVRDDDTAESYYTVITVSSNPTVPVSPPGVADITLAGTAPAGSSVVAKLLLGEEFVELESQPGDSFSFAIPRQGSDLIYLDCYVEDADGNDFTYYDPNPYTATKLNIDYGSVFSGVSVPSFWASNLAWNDATTTLSWDSAAGATYYEIEFIDTNLDSVLNAIVEDGGGSNWMIAPLSSSIVFMVSILPVYSDGFIEGFMPAQKADGVMVWLDDIAARLKTGNDVAFSYFDDSSALNSNAINSIAIDEFGGYVLIGTNVGGVNYSDDLVTWEQLTTADGLVGNSVQKIDVESGYWIGTSSGVSYVDDTGTITNITTSEGLVGNNVFAVAFDEFNNGMWFGTTAGVSFLDFDTLSFTDYTVASTGGGLAANDVRTIAADPYGGVWFCTLSSGVSYLDGIGGSWTTFTTADGLANNGARGMAFDEEGGVWFATGNGVSYLDGTGVFHTYRTPDGLYNNFVNCVAIDDEGGVWFGTGLDAASGGVSYYDDEGFVSLTSADGLASGYVTSIAFDYDDGLWIGVYGGGVCFLP